VSHEQGISMSAKDVDTGCHVVLSGGVDGFHHDD
jgi:hypothetical protein